MTNKNNIGDWNSGDWNSGNRNSGNRNSGYWNSGDLNSGDWNSGDWNSGYWNSGNRNSGCFNTNEPNARFFNEETKIKLSDFYNSDACPDMSNFPLNRWINKEDMTETEKEEINGWKTTGGYLRTLTYKEAWAVFWKETTEKNRQKFLNLPNFDAKIFKEITGIDVNEIDDKEKWLEQGEKEGWIQKGKIIK